MLEVMVNLKNPEERTYKLKISLQTCQKSELPSYESARFEKKVLDQRCSAPVFWFEKASFLAPFKTQSELFKDFHVLNNAESELKYFWIRVDQH